MSNGNVDGISVGLFDGSDVGTLMLSVCQEILAQSIVRQVVR